MRGKSKQHIGQTRKRWIVISVLFIFLSAAILGVGVYLHLNFEREMPEEWINWSGMGQSPRFFAYHFTDRTNREGERIEVIAEAFGHKPSSYVAYPDIPTDLIHAFVAIEDKRFFSHRGVDWYRTAAASLRYLTGGENRFGGSTITQQLVKNTTGHDEVSLTRKVQEIFYALDLERKLDKREILERYLNIIHFSDNCNGIAEAADHYFSKEVSELTLTEIAAIAAITNSPSYYNPIRHPEHNRERRNLILGEMYRQGYLEEAEYQAAVDTPLVLNVRDEGEGEGINSWYVDMVLEDITLDLMREFGLGRAAASHLLYSGGLQIDMAVDPEIQSIVEDYYSHALGLPSNTHGEGAQSAIIVIDPKTGDVLGIAGAAGEKRGNRLQNFATQTQRPPGSALKPISIYAPALEEGLITWASVYDDVPTHFGFSGRAAWPRNATGEYRGLTTVAYAVAHSTNTVPVRILEELGIDRSYLWASERFHLKGLVSESGANDRDVAALALGQLNYGVTLREITDAYTVFADEGRYHPWRSYYRVLDAEGRILLSSPDRSEIVLSSANAAIMTKLLRGVVEYGTSSSITLGRLMECAGKTGTTSNDSDRWFIGYTPDYLCGVWCGYEYPEPLVGRNLCTGIWNRVMRQIVEEKGGKERFSVPSNVIRVSFCPDSGSIPSEACTLDPRGVRTQTGWFVLGTEPKSHCTRHVLCEYDAENGGIDHGFCPEENRQQVALLQIQRSFPMQVSVTDAQYVWRGDPRSIAPNSDPTRPYFDGTQSGYVGISATRTPFNRSCTAHLHPPDPMEDWDYLDREDRFSSE